MNLESHLLTHKVLALEDYFDANTILSLYYDLTDNAVFTSSTVSDKRGDTNAQADTAYSEVAHAGRVSETAFYHSFSPKATDYLKFISQEVCDLLGVKVSQMEPWQCTRYGSGGKFDYHDDCGNWASNERLYTVLITLRAPDVGGATHFRKLGITVPSKNGCVLIWRNLNEDYLCDGQAEHAGLPVGAEGEHDEKTILVTWIRRYDYVP